MGLVYLFIEVKKNADQTSSLTPPMIPHPTTSSLSTRGEMSIKTSSLTPPMIAHRHKFAVNTWGEDEDVEYRISALGQNAHYAHMIQTRQFRTCVFSLTISGSTARIMRWDRSGCVGHQAFDYKASPMIL